MNRKELLEALALVEPSLATNDLIPALTHYWFTGDDIMAYNDIIAISVPYKTEFRGSIKGKVLYDFLSKCTGPKISLKDAPSKGKKSKKNDDAEDAHNVQIKCGRSSITMRLFPDNTFLFEMPDYGDWSTISVEADSLIDALSVCLQSIGNHVSEPERNSITVMPQERNKLHMYSTDNVTMSHAVLANQERSDLPERFVLSQPFCAAALRLVSKFKNKSYQFFVDEDHVVIEFDGGVKLFGRLVEDLHPLDFEKVFASHLPKRNNKLMISVPKRLSIAIERAYVAISRSVTPTTEFAILDDDKGSYLRIVAKSEYGTVRDKVRLDTDIGDSVSIRVDLKRIKDCGFEVFDHIRFTDKCIVLSKGDNMYHLISVLGK